MQDCNPSPRARFATPEHQSERHLSIELRDAVERSYGYRISETKALKGGYESEVFLIDGEDGRRVLRVGPQWRSSEQLEWSYALAAYAAIELPEVVAPYATTTGEHVIRHAERPVSLWPFIDGRSLDPDDESERDLAASALARLQRRLVDYAPGAPCPPTSPLALADEPDALRDRDLDQWLAERRAARPVPRAPMHGDYWRNNLLCRGTRIVGIIDWDDARIGSVDRELAWAVWEFCADRPRDTLDMARAGRFLDAYEESGGPVPVTDRTFVIAYIREHLRYEIRRALGAGERGEPFDRDYLESELRAFANLQGRSLQSSRKS